MSQSVRVHMGLLVVLVFDEILRDLTYWSRDT